jgi:hypothetical protein
VKTFLLVTVAVLAMVGTASARPQLASPSIGWIDVSDITCEPTSDHTCVVKDSLALTYVDQSSAQKTYQVLGGTVLDILNARDDQDLAYHPEETKGRVEVAIIIPSDWDQRPGHESKLRPDKLCHLKTTSGAIDGSLSSKSPFVSLSCK